MEGLRAPPSAVSRAAARRGVRARDLAYGSVQLGEGEDEEQRRPRTAPLAGKGWGGAGRSSEELPRYSEKDEGRERSEWERRVRETDQRIKDELVAFGII